MKTETTSRGRRLVLLALLVSVLAALLVAWSTTPAAAAPQSDTDQYQPAGIGEFFPSPEVDPALTKTLFEEYPVSAWYFDYRNDSWWNMGDNMFDSNLSAVANVFFGINQFLVRGAIFMTWTVQDTGVGGQIGDQLTPVVGAVAGELGGWMLPSALAVGGLIALASGSSSAERWRGIGAVLMAGLIATSLMVKPEVWVGTTEMIQEIGQTSVSRVAGSISTELTIPFDGPQATFGDDATENSMRTMADSIWRTYVATPWCIGEFGTTAACQRWGEDILSRTSSERADFINDTIEPAIGGYGSDAYNQVTGRDGTQRILISIVALLTSCVFALVVIFLAAASSLFSMLVWLMLIVGPFFIFMSPIPGFPRRWATNWGNIYLSFVLFTFLATLVLTGALTISAITMGLAGEYGWLVAAIESLVGIIAAVLMIFQLKRIMSTSDSGGRGLLSAVLTMSMLTRLRPRRPPAPSAPRSPATPGANAPAGTGPGAGLGGGSGALLGGSSNPNAPRIGGGGRPTPPSQLIGASQRRPDLPPGGSGSGALTGAGDLSHTQIRPIGAPTPRAQITAGPGDSSTTAGKREAPNGPTAGGPRRHVDTTPRRPLDANAPRRARTVPGATPHRGGPTALPKRRDLHQAPQAGPNLSVGPVRRTRGAGVNARLQGGPPRRSGRTTTTPKGTLV